ncbi:MAG: tetratricopeptide repeat protein, partial [Spirochaetales bacterium]|nr:tetratricopeptide repeat protein [Spirochaetales bacterium]
PQLIAEIEELRTKEVMEIPITALFKNDVLEITEKDSAQSQIIITYSVGGTSLTANRNESLRIYDRNSINWDDDRKAAAFVTAKDPTILKFSRNVTSEIGSLSGSVLNRNLSDGIALFEAIREYGLEYKIDPDSSYEVLSQDESLTDYLQFPVQTLDYKTGDCDDLSILYSAMLEAVSVETAFVTTPGHIYIAFSLGLNESQAGKIFSTTENLIIAEDKAWIPVEITLLNDGFLKAWETGARQWREAVVHNSAGFIPVRTAWSEYEPTWFGSGENTSVVERIPQISKIASSYKSSLNQFVQVQITPLVERMEERISQRSSSRLINQFGTLYARYGLIDKAEVQFKKAARQNYVPSIVNLGNIFFLSEDYRQANVQYEKAYKINPDNTDVILALARTGFEMEKYKEAQEYYDIAQILDPDQASKYAYLSGGSTSTGRASDVSERK